MIEASPSFRAADRPAQSQLLLRNAVEDSGGRQETPAAINVILNANFDFHRREKLPK
jgi:hypothetical protein